jgi:hypothetical protein
MNNQEKGYVKTPHTLNLHHKQQFTAEKEQWQNFRFATALKPF